MNTIDIGILPVCTEGSTSSKHNNTRSNPPSWILPTHGTSDLVIEMSSLRLAHHLSAHGCSNRDRGLPPDDETEPSKAVEGAPDIFRGKFVSAPVYWLI